jgi:cell division protein FtsI (penicillin-binding protein 3)
MVGVVDSGTAKRIHTGNFEIAGKTGTAQIADANRGYQKVYQASFAGFFPADQPRYSCIVVVNSPSNGIYYGGSVAGPVFRAIADKIYASHPELFQPTDADSTQIQQPLVAKGFSDDVTALADLLGIEVSSDDATADWSALSILGDSSRVQPMTAPRAHTVPNVVGMGLRDALPLLENAGLKVEVHGVGKVQRQSLLPGQTVRRGQSISVTLQ